KPYTNTLSPDPALRSNATNQLETSSRQHFAPDLDSLLSVLISTYKPSHIKNAAGLAIKNSLTSREVIRNEELIQRWKSVPDDIRMKVKDGLIQMLGDNKRPVFQFSSQAIAAIRAEELPLGMWSGLISQLLQIINTPERGVSLRQSATLVKLPEVLAAQSNEILTPVFSGARKEEPSPKVQLASVDALLDSLEFVCHNFEREGERNYIMQVICKATQSPTPDVQVAAFGCLVRIIQLYYLVFTYIAFQTSNEQTGDHCCNENLNQHLQGSPQRTWPKKGVAYGLASLCGCTCIETA
ncbi:hypothetical protein O181_124268, partial [Austropuccinia psidii MF-1]|nr:hypothetical protein [Austropuccinia psidii MF-1]